MHIPRKNLLAAGQWLGLPGQRAGRSSPHRLTGQVPATRTALIVDNDLGFVCWLGGLFNEIGSRPLPALSCEDAVALMKRLGIEPDLIVFNPRLPGADGMLQNLIRQHPHIELVSIGHSLEALVVPIHARATVERPSAGEPISRVEWLEKVRRLLKGSGANSSQGRGWLGSEST